MSNTSKYALHARRRPWLARPRGKPFTASCPDSDEIYITLTNQMTLSPGALNQCRRLRWNIEKAFDQLEQKLDERKAWSASEKGKRILAIAMSLVHNLLRLLEAKLKSEEGIEDTKVINA
jgi:IS4 transposase